MMNVHIWRSPAAIRSHCGLVGELALGGDCAEWLMNLSQLPKMVVAVNRAADRDYPDEDIPFHSRWRHLPAVTFANGGFREDLRLKEEGGECQHERRCRG